MENNLLCHVLYYILYVYYVNAVVCPGLSDPVNGVLTSTGTNTGDSAAFTCKCGFELVGASVVHRLSNGTWDKPSPVCLTPAGNNVWYYIFNLS